MECLDLEHCTRGKNCQQDEMLLQDGLRLVLLSEPMFVTYNLHILCKLILCTELNQSKMWKYMFFCLRMKIVRIWLWYVLYIYTPFGILTSFPFRDGERGATKTEIRLMSGSCLMKLHSKHLMFHFRPTARPPLLLLGSVACFCALGWPLTMNLGDVSSQCILVTNELA